MMTTTCVRCFSEGLFAPCLLCDKHLCGACVMEIFINKKLASITNTTWRRERAPWQNPFTLVSAVFSPKYAPVYFHLCDHLPFPYATLAQMAPTTATHLSGDCHPINPLAPDGVDHHLKIACPLCRQHTRGTTLGALGRVFNHIKTVH